MKNLLLLITLILFSVLAKSQSQIALPPGTKPYSSNIFKAPDRTIWTGKPGDYSPLANGFYVDSVINTIPSKVIVTPLSLKINKENSNPEWSRLPTANTAGTQLVDGGIIAGYALNLFTNNGIAKRLNGKIQVGNATNNLDAVNKYQLDSATQNNLSSSNLGSRSNIYLSEYSSIDQNVKQGVIIASSISNLRSDPNRMYQTAIIASNGSNINTGRERSAIIASSQSEIEAYTGNELIKWNSAIIASYNSKIQSSNSYTLVTGQGVVSNASAQLAMGLYNIIEPSRSVTDPLKKSLVIGNGNNTEQLDRSNAFYVTHGGRAWVQNEFEVDKAGGAVILKSPDGKRWQIKISNTGVLTTTVLP